MFLCCSNVNDNFFWSYQNIIYNAGIFKNPQCSLQLYRLTEPVSPPPSPSCSPSCNFLTYVRNPFVQFLVIQCRIVAFKKFRKVNIFYPFLAMPLFALFFKILSLILERDLGVYMLLQREGEWKSLLLSANVRHPTLIFHALSKPHLLSEHHW